MELEITNPDTLELREARNPTLTREVETEVRQRYLEGENSVELGKVFGVDPTTIRNILVRNHVKTRPCSEARKVATGGLTDKQESEICRRYRNGATTSVLARLYGVSTATIHRLIRRNLGTLR